MYRGTPAHFFQRVNLVIFQQIMFRGGGGGGGGGLIKFVKGGFA